MKSVYYISFTTVTVTTTDISNTTTNTTTTIFNNMLIKSSTGNFLFYLQHKFYKKIFSHNVYWMYINRVSYKYFILLTSLLNRLKRNGSSLITNPLTPELNPSTQRCLTRLVTGDFATLICISLIHAWKTNKCNNYLFSLLIMYGSSYMFQHYIAIFKERS
jgi:hypothetical protein